MPGDNLFDSGGYIFSSDIFGGTTIKCGSGGDTIFAIPNVTSPLTIQGNDPTTAPGDTLNLSIADAQNPVFTPGGTGAGSYTFDNFQPLAYTGIETLNIDTLAPAIIDESFAFNYDVPAQLITVQFNKDVSSMFSSDSLQLDNLTTTQTISAAMITAAYDTNSNLASFTFPTLPLGALPDGNYNATIPAGLQDQFGNAIHTPSTYAFFFLTADANHDRSVDIADFSVLSMNFNAATGATFSQGDFNYDGAVNALDFNMLAANFGNYLAPPPSPPLSSPLASISALPAANDRPTLFGNVPVTSDNVNGDVLTREMVLR